jgi:L-threonylcarbamoyladenylate synthase
VDPRLRSGVDLVLDAGDLPGTPSTVIDLTRYDEDGTWELVREGAVPLDAVVRSLG